MKAHVTTELLVSAASALTAGRLLYLKLAKRFPALVAWLVYFSVISLTVALLNPKTPLYFRVYIIGIPLYCIFGIMAVRELFALIFDHYPGIRTLGKWAMYGAMGLALALTLMATSVFWSQSATGRALSRIYYLQLGHRSVIFGLAVIIISLLFSISRYPLHLSRNALISCGFFGAVFLSDAAQSLLDSLAPRLHNDNVDWTTNLLVAMCLCSWATWLQHETVPEAARVSFADPSEDHLLRELASLNQMLSRAARR